MLAIPFIAIIVFHVAAQDVATLKVEGRGVEGRPPYRGGGVVKFIDVSIGAQILHYQSGQQMPLPLQIRYDVLEKAPVLLTSRLGTEHWRLYDFDAETMAALYTDENIDLSQAGRHSTKSTQARFGSSYGPLPQCGLVGLRGHYCFLIDQPNGKWIDVTDPPVFFDQTEIVRELTFTLTVCTPAGLQQREVKARFHRGDGLAKADEFMSAEQGYKLPRTRDAKVRETRAIWVSTSDIATTDGIDELVNRCKQAQLNMIVPCIFVRNTFLAQSVLMPTGRLAEKGLDPLGYLIEKAHAAHLEVHPWFCVTYRDRHFRGWFAEKHGTNVDMIDENGKTISLGADVHRPEYRQFVVDLMVGVARDYRVDGIHLDYMSALADDNKLVTGLSLYMRSGGEVLSRPADLVQQQVTLVRQMGIHGYCLFAYSHLSQQQFEVLREKVNSEPAVPYFR